MILRGVKPLLAISGKRFSGKDTFAALIREHAIERGAQLEAYAFAGESKRLFVEAQAKAGVKVDLDRLTTDRAYKEEWRPKLTQFTVDSIAKDPLVFCRAVADRIEKSTHPALITDLRLKLEVEHLNKRFALHVVRLERGDAGRTAAGWKHDADKDSHHTETELDDPSLWSEVITNDGTFAELSLKADKVISAYLAAFAER